MIGQFLRFEGNGQRGELWVPLAAGVPPRFADMMVLLRGTGAGRYGTLCLVSGLRRVLCRRLAAAGGTTRCGPF